MRAREALGESLAEPSGQLRISALHLAKNLVIAPMLNEFVRRYPKVQLEIRYEDQLVDIVRNGWMPASAWPTPCSRAWSGCN